MTRPKLLSGDVREVLQEMDSECVQCVVTSPPYWGLRNYGTEGQLGLEETPEEYIDNMVEVFREVKRVLRKDGTVWLNLGDSFMDKNLVGIPWRVALALQADGWWLRSDIIWSKPNPMPESIKDRLSKSHEYVFLLTKSKSYYYDNEAIKEPYSESSIQRINQVSFDQQEGGSKDYGKIPIHPNYGNSARKAIKAFKENLGSGRNKRTVWEINTQPYPGAHFATFPEEIPEICIKAGTSEGGSCLECGTPYNRIVEKGEKVSLEDYKGQGKKDYASAKAENPSDVKRRTLESMREVIYKGWKSGCSCKGVNTPCLVLDPFVGSGTTCAVASRLKRASIGIELNEEYLKLARKRCKVESESLFKYV
mgnify:CR=1 FL=1